MRNRNTEESAVWATCVALAGIAALGIAALRYAAGISDPTSAMAALGGGLMLIVALALK